MTKTRTIQARDRVAPVLMAVGLWLAGNIVMTETPAKGQEVTSNYGYGCVTTSSDVQNGDKCTFSVSQNSCVGNCSWTVYTITTCSSYVLNGTTIACQTVQGQPEGTTVQQYSGNCQPMPQTFPTNQPPCGCSFGPLQSTSYTKGPVCAYPA